MEFTRLSYLWYMAFRGVGWQPSHANNLGRRMALSGETPSVMSTKYGRDVIDRLLKTARPDLTYSPWKQ